MLFKRIAIIGSFALTALTSAVAAGGALEGRMRSAADHGEAGEGADAARARRADRRQHGPCFTTFLTVK